MDVVSYLTTCVCVGIACSQEQRGRAIAWAVGGSRVMCLPKNMSFILISALF